MKKSRKLVLVLAIIFTMFYTGIGTALAKDADDAIGTEAAIELSASSGFEVSGKAAVIMEATTKRVLYEKNARQKLPMASTTKVMTAFLAIEKGDLDSIVTVSKNASGVEGSSIWLSVGEKMTLKDMLYGLMLSSGNDAAVAISEHIGGDVENFVSMMNERAKELGALDTNFVNPNGLPADNHYTTAYDLALISAHAMNNEVFKEIVSTQAKSLPWEGHEWNRSLRNKNKILWSYEGGNGVKTGFTKEAGRCLVAAAERENMQVVTSVLNCGDMFGESINMLNYAFKQYSMHSIYQAGEPMGVIPVIEGAAKQIEVRTDREVRVPILESEAGKIEKQVELLPEVTAPVKKGDVLGSIKVYLNGELFAESPLYAAEDIEDNSYGYNLGKIIKRWFGR